MRQDIVTVAEVGAAGSTSKIYPDGQLTIECPDGMKSIFGENAHTKSFRNQQRSCGNRWRAQVPFLSCECSFAHPCVKESIVKLPFRVLHKWLTIGPLPQWPMLHTWLCFFRVRRGAAQTPPHGARKVSLVRGQGNYMHYHWQGRRGLQPGREKRFTRTIRGHGLQQAGREQSCEAGRTQEQVINKTRPPPRLDSPYSWINDLDTESYQILC